MSTNDNTVLDPDVEPVILYQTKDQKRIDEMCEEIERLQKASGRQSVRTLSEGNELQEARDALEEIEAEALPRAVVCEMAQLPRRKWQSLVREHSPRDDNAADLQLGVNLFTFPEALVPACLASPKFATPADRDDFLDGLSDARYDKLFWAAFKANRGGGKNPKDFLAPSAKSSSATEN